jgi:hypothetical protein
MRKTPSLRFITGCTVVLLLLGGYALPGFAQTGSPPISGSANSAYFGLEVGYGLHTEEGSFVCNCGNVFEDGEGKGFIASAFYEMELSRNFSAGLKVGFDFKNTTSTSTLFDTVIVQPGGSKSNPDTAAMSVQRTGVLNFTLLRFAPYLQYQVLNTELFVQIGTGISYVMSNKLTQSRSLIGDSVNLADGSTIHNLTFTNGTRSEAFEEAAIPNVPSILFSAIVSAGFGFGFGDFVISPIVTYDLPLSNYQTNYNMKISSLYGSVGLKFKL